MKKEATGVPTPKKVMKGLGAIFPFRRAINVAPPLITAPAKGKRGMSQVRVSMEMPKSMVLIIIPSLNSHR